MVRVQNVNTTDIAGAIRLARGTMGSVFNADDNDIPFFRSAVLPDAYLAFNNCFSEGHVPGRHLNALLTAEAVLGEPADEEVIAKHRRAALYSYGGSLPLPLNRDKVGGTAPPLPAPQPARRVSRPLRPRPLPRRRLGQGDGRGEHRHDPPLLGRRSAAGTGRPSQPRASPWSNWKSTSSRRIVSPPPRSSAASPARSARWSSTTPRQARRQPWISHSRSKRRPSPTTSGRTAPTTCSASRSIPTPPPAPSPPWPSSPI